MEQVEQVEQVEVPKASVILKLALEKIKTAVTGRRASTPATLTGCRPR